MPCGLSLQRRALGSDRTSPVFLIDPKALPSGWSDDSRWLQWTRRGLRVLFWSTWSVWLAQLFSFATGSVLPLVTPKLKQPALREVAAWADVGVLVVASGLVLGAMFLARPPALESTIGRLESKLAGALRSALVPLWGAWWTLAVAVVAAQRFAFELPLWLAFMPSMLFSGACALSFGYLSRLASVLGQRTLATIAAIMAVYAILPLDLETAAYPLVGEPGWKAWLPVMSSGRLAAWMVVFGGALVVSGRLRRAIEGVDDDLATPNDR